MSYRGDSFLREFTSTNFLSSLMKWNELLQFYHQHSQELDNEDILRFYDISETCRHFWNKDKITVKILNGKETTVVKAGINCRKEEVFSDLYQRVEQIRKIQNLRSRSFIPLSLPIEHTQLPLTVGQN